MSSLIRVLICSLMLITLLPPNAASQSATRLGTDTEAPPQRLALLIGNSEYQHLKSLKNPKNDVDQLATKLGDLGFQTFVEHNLSHNDFVYKLAEFAARIAPGDIALFYYSGHGVQLSGMNYLIPVDMQSPPSGVILQGNGISTDQIRNALGAAKLSLMILDACRTYANFQVKGLNDGLAPVFPRGTLVAYAADEGQAASDNDTENLSLFTKHMIRELDKRDETLCQFFERVREAVDLASAHVQFPFIYDGVIGDFVFNRTTTAEAHKLAGISSEQGRKHVWTAIQNSDDPNDFAAFLTPALWDKTKANAAQARLVSLMSSTIKAAGVVPLDPQTPLEFISASNQGQRLFYEGAYAEAAMVYQNLVASRPSDFAAKYDYATCLLHLGRLDEALHSLSNAVELSPEFVWAYYNQGVAHHLQGKLKQAIDDYTRALKLRPNYAIGYNNLALAKRDTGDIAGAEQDVGKALALDSHYAPAYFNGAKILTDLGDLHNAVAYTDKGKTLTVPLI